MNKTKIRPWTCCRCKRTFDDELPACSNITPGFDRCKKCYAKEIDEYEKRSGK